MPSSSCNDNEEPVCKDRSQRHRKKKHKRHKRRRSHSSDKSDSTASREPRRSRKRDSKRSKKRKSKKSKTEHSVSQAEEGVEWNTTVNRSKLSQQGTDTQLIRTVPTTGGSQRREERRQAMIPMSQQQYEAARSQVREVYDHESGRNRLIRGDGEIIERIVSRDQHQQINRTATQSDGTSFTRQVRDRARF